MAGRAFQVWGGETIPSQEDAEGKRKVLLSVFTTELAALSDGRTQIYTDYHRIVKA